MGTMCQSVSPNKNSKNPSEWVKGEMVGYGSFGTIHLAMNKSTAALFVVKSAHTDAGRVALDNEVKILKSLSSSPYIVQCLGTEEEENNLNVFMEYMAGGSLADVAHKFGCGCRGSSSSSSSSSSSLDEGLIRVYTREILLGLKHIHQHGIVHCDLKCKNVLLGSSGNIKLADFGCAKRVILMDSSSSSSSKGFKNNNNSSLLLSATTVVVVVGGTPLWMAPEVLRNEMLDFAADIWSLGCTVIEMATGAPPWAGDHEVASNNNPMAAMLRIAHGGAVPHFPTHFSKEGLDFLTKCLEREPNNRSTAEELLNHPFVVSSSTIITRPFSSSHKVGYASSSPASVLEEVQSFEDTYFDLDDELESPQGNHFPTRNSFAHNDEPKGTAIILLRQQREDRPLASSSSGNNWITVRSG